VKIRKKEGKRKELEKEDETFILCGVWGKVSKTTDDLSRKRSRKGDEKNIQNAMEQTLRKIRIHIRYRTCLFRGKERAAIMENKKSGG